MKLRLKEELRFGYCSGKQHNLMFFLEHNAGRLRPLLCGLVFFMHRLKKAFSVGLWREPTLRWCVALGNGRTNAFLGR